MFLKVLCGSLIKVESPVQDNCICLGKSLFDNWKRFFYKAKKKITADYFILKYQSWLILLKTLYHILFNSLFIYFSYNCMPIIWKQDYNKKIRFETCHFKDIWAGIIFLLNKRQCNCGKKYIVHIDITYLNITFQVTHKLEN